MEKDQDKQARYDELNQKFDRDDITTEEITEGVRLYAELYPEDKWWDDDWTPEEIWPQLHENRKG
jgi:hypothetical protein